MNFSMFIRATTLGNLIGRVIAMHGRVLTVIAGNCIQRVHLHDVTSMATQRK